jgi:transcriptional regulator with XRE-family HTH domain
MDAPLSYTDVAAKADISPSYAFEIVNGTRRPGLATALKIYDATGLLFGPLEGLDEGGITYARQMAPKAA